MEAQQQLFGLMTVAEDQQKAIQAAIEGLVAERQALAKERAALAQAALTVQKAVGVAIGAAVRESMAGVSQTAVAAFAQAAGPFTREVQSIAKQAKAAAEEVAGAAQWLGLRAVGVAVGCVVVVGLAAWGMVAWQRHEVDALMGQQAQLAAQVAQEQATVATLDQRGGRMDLQHCGTRRRLCVRVDKATGYGKDADYFVVHGY